MTEKLLNRSPGLSWHVGSFFLFLFAIPWPILPFTVCSPRHWWPCKSRQHVNVERNIHFPTQRLTVQSGTQAQEQPSPQSCQLAVPSAPEACTNTAASLWERTILLSNVQRDRLVSGSEKEVSGTNNMEGVMKTCKNNNVESDQDEMYVPASTIPSLPQDYPQQHRDLFCFSLIKKGQTGYFFLNLHFLCW